MLKLAAWAVCASSAAAFGPVSPVRLLATTSSSRQSCARPQKALVMSAHQQQSEANISRRGALAAALSVVPAIASAEEERPMIPESEMIKAPKNSCEQGGEKEFFCEHQRLAVVVLLWQPASGDEQQDPAIVSSMAADENIVSMLNLTHIVLRQLGASALSLQRATLSFSSCRRALPKTG